MALVQVKNVKKILNDIGVILLPQPVTRPDSKIYEPEELKNEEYKVDFKLWEMKAAIEQLGNERSAAGPDGITNAMFKNLPEAAKRMLIKLIKDVWHECNIPDRWKLFWVCPSSKPGRE